MFIPRPYIIDSRNSQFLNYFEYLVMTLAIWNAIWTPLTISFQRAADIGESIPFQLIDAFVDTIFWMDIFLQFTTCYVDKASGEAIFLRRKIASHYVFQGSFLIDFMSTFPFSQIGEVAQIKSATFYLFADIMSLMKV